MSQTWVERVSADPERRARQRQERLILEVTELIRGFMIEQNVTKSRLATRLGKSRAFVTQLLDGRANMTLRTISDIATALGYALTVGGVSLDGSSRTAKPCNAPGVFRVEEDGFNFNVPDNSVKLPRPKAPGAGTGQVQVA